MHPSMQSVQSIPVYRKKFIWNWARLRSDHVLTTNEHSGVFSVRPGGFFWIRLKANEVMFKISVKKTQNKNKTKPHRHIFGIMLAPQCLFVFSFFFALMILWIKCTLFIPNLGKWLFFCCFFYRHEKIQKKPQTPNPPKTVTNTKKQLIKKQYFAFVFDVRSTAVRKSIE